MGSIYLATHKDTGRIYVGQTIRSVAWRWQSHIQASRHLRRCSFVDRAIAKYGPQAFFVQELSAHDSQLALDNAERAAIIVFSAMNSAFGFNLRDGGSRGKHSPESCAKIGNGHRGKVISAETRAKLSKAGKGQKKRPRSEEHRARLSAANTGKTGRKSSEEHKAKISARANYRTAWIARKQELVGKLFKSKEETPCP